MTTRSASSRPTQMPDPWQRKITVAQQAGREKQQLQAFDCASGRMAARDDVVTQFVGLLVGVGRDQMHVEDVSLPFLVETQVGRVHSGTLLANDLDM